MTNPAHIIFTRKLDEPQKTAALERGFKIIDHDFLSYEYADNRDIIDLLKLSTLPFVFTSQHAVIAVKHIIEKYRINLDNKTCFCIAGETERQAVLTGFTALGLGENSAELASEIIRRNAKGVVFFCGNIRRNELRDRLTENHIPIREIEVYSKTLVPLKIETSFDGIVFYSPSQIDAFFIRNTLPSETPAFCIGGTTGGHLQARGHKNTIIADQKNTEALLNKIYQYYK